MKKKDKKKTKWPWIFFAFILFIILYTGIIWKDSLLLEGIGIGISALFIAIHLYFIIQNKTIRKKEFQSIKKLEDQKIASSPLELYLVNTLWNHERVSIGENQILAEMMYLYDKKVLQWENQTIKIGNVAWKEIDSYAIFTLSCLFLEGANFRQSQNSRIEKLKRIQKDQEGVLPDMIKSRITNNLKYVDIGHSLIKATKEMNFEVEKNGFDIVFTIASTVLVIFELVSAIAFLNHATLYNFYLPIVGAFLQVFFFTNSYRENLTVQKENERLKVLIHYANFYVPKPDWYALALNQLSYEEKKRLLDNIIE